MKRFGWQDDASCAQVIVRCEDEGCQHIDCIEVVTARRVDRMFFAPITNGGVAMCLACPVFRECITWAADSYVSWQYGLRGGLRPHERTTTPMGRPDVEAAIELAEDQRGLLVSA